MALSGPLSYSAEPRNNAVALTKVIFLLGSIAELCVQIFRRYMKIRLTKAFTFDMAHGLPGYDGACRNIHGHTYQLEVTVIGEPLDDPGNPKNGMVMDFKVLKAIVKKKILEVFDHALVLPEASPKELLSALRNDGQKLVTLPFQPTCERLLIYLVETMEEDLPAGVSLHRVRLYETPTSFAEWTRYDNS